MKSEQLQIRVSKQEKAAIRGKAKSANQDMSEWILSQIFPDTSKTFQKLLDELKVKKKQERSYVLAAINDFLAELSPGELTRAVSDVESAKLGDFELSYVSAMVEYICNIKGVQVPDWALNSPCLTAPYFGSDIQSLRLHLLSNSPAPFRKRNIFIDSSIGDRI